MKKYGLLLIGLTVFTLAGCNCKCNVKEVAMEAMDDEVKQFCLDKGGTYSQITSPEEAYGECMFPSGIGCRDEYILNGECQYEANTENIDTEEERQVSCEENIKSYFIDMMGNAELTNIEYGDEEEYRDEDGILTIIHREFTIRYSRDGQNWICPGICEADFVQGGVSAIFNQEYMDIQ